MLEIFNSASRRKEPFQPLDPATGKVGMYYCGVTVYDSLHIGHTRAHVVPDVVRRYLEYCGYTVRFVNNFTDVDDKIIRRALSEKRSWRELTSYYMNEFGRLITAVGNRPADAQPRATDHIPEMIDLVERLLERGHAYVADDGDVYFDTASFPTYGALAGRDLDQQEANRGGRLSDEQLAAKRHPADFILWKLEINDPDEWRNASDQVPGWDTPWGRGRPGWHLECSAMSNAYLGMPIDIHGGGQDLRFPHHENERAQNDCGYCGMGDEPTSSVRFWIHNGFVTLEAKTREEAESEYADTSGTKMSKSLGNVIWLDQLIWPLGPHDPMAVRMMMLACHYRSPLRFSEELLRQSGQRVEKIYGTMERLGTGLSRAPEDGEGEPTDATREAVEAAREHFERGMNDDFNTPVALAAIEGLLTFANRELSDADGRIADRRHVFGALRLLCGTLGLRTERLGTGAGSGDEEALLELLGSLRSEARAAKNYALADAIRDRLGGLGYELRDRKDGGIDIQRR
ncbi:MAG: cysteine--tRNA ligase [Acidobacteriota bacterium]